MSASLAGSPRCRARHIFVAAVLMASASLAPAYELGPSWPDGNIVMHLQLGSPDTPLADGATTWGTVAESALNDWNAFLARSRFTVVRDSTAAKDSRNRINNVFFAANVYGSPFQERVLAVTQMRYTSGRLIEADVVFNSGITWDSYRGNRRSAMDFRRVALHEFGHALGLNHPDEATPRQSVAAIMNSQVGNIDSLRDDDIEGARALYDPLNASSAPAIVAQPQGATLQTGDRYTLNVGVSGTGPFTYEWYFQGPNQSEPEPFLLATGASYTIGSVQPADTGTYSAVVRRNGALVVSNNAVLSVRPVSTSADTTLANISTRGVVGTGNNVMIAGIVISGSTPKTVFVRAAGPALGDFGVTGALANPTLRIVRSADQTVMAENDDWETGGNSSGIRAAETRLGAFQFRSGSRDSAVLATLPPGNYTAVVTGVNSTTGVALVEAYDADPDAITARSRKLVNIATRGQVNSGENVLIAGLVVAGAAPRTYLIRAIGPTLARAPFNIGGALADPFLQLYRGENLLRENDDWDSSSTAQPALREASQRVGAFPMMETRDAATQSGLDAAMLITLQPGSYTAKVTGFENRTGVALIEIYEVPYRFDTGTCSPELDVVACAGGRAPPTRAEFWRGDSDGARPCAHRLYEVP